MLTFSRFRTLGSFHSRSYPPCCISAFFEVPIPTRTVISFSDSSSWYTSTASSGPLLLMQHFYPTLAFKPLIVFRPLCICSLCTLTTASCFWLYLFTSCFFFPSLTLSGFFNEMLGVSEPGALNCYTFISSHPVDLICIQESNLNFSSSFRIPGFSALRSDCSHSRSDIFSTDVTDVSGGVIIFVRQDLSFSELFNSSLTSLNPCSDYVEANISLKNSSSPSFLNVNASPIRFSPTDSRTNFFSPSSTNLFILGDFNCHHPLYDSKSTYDPCGEKAFDWFISSDLLPLNDFDTPTLLYCSSGRLSSPDISLALFSLTLFCSWEVLQNLGSNHLPILLTIPFSPVFRPNERLPSFNFQKARWDDFAFYFDFHCPSAEEYSFLFLSVAAVLVRRFHSFPFCQRRLLRTC